MNRLEHARVRTAQRLEVTLRRLYLGLPLTGHHRWTIKRWGFRLTGWLMNGTASYQRWESTERHARHVQADAVMRPLSEADVSRLIDGLLLPGSDRAEVSVVIPVHGQLEYTLRCLSAIARHPSRRPLEVIVVDDRSPDRTAETLARVPGLQLIRTASNLGFVRSCNLGASHARGRVLLFLNNDTEVLAGWCDELLDTFDTRADAGIVGAKLLYPDGRLQEAGGIIWRDGSGWNYGRSDDPSRPEYSYRRDVDYVSGAALAMPRALFQRLAGFDERYVPAYAEDSDLAFRVRELGYSVVYQPLAQVIHREGGTGGTDLTKGVKAHQVANGRKLLERWRSRLTDRPEPGVDVVRARERGVGLRALVLDHCTPEPDKDAGSITALNIMRLLQRHGCKVTFVPEDNYLFLDGYTQLLQRAGIECLYAPHVTSVDEHLAAHGSLYDLVVIFRFTAAQRRLDAVRRFAPQAKVVLHTSDLHFLRLEREAALTGSAATREQAARTRQEELAIIRRVDATIVHSPVEERLIRAQCPEALVHVFGWAIDIPGTTVPYEDRRDIAFLGGFQHPPNVDAAMHFARDILPLVHARLPGVVFRVIGSHPPADLRAMASDTVEITGFVPDLSSHLDRVRVAVAPIRFGAGIKGKVVTAMSHGVPNVLTTLAAEGLGITDGADAWIADAADAFADAVVRVYTDDAWWARLSANGLALARRQFSFDGGLPIVGRILASLGLPAIPASGQLQPLVPRGEIECVPLASVEDERRHAAEAATRLERWRSVEQALVPDRAGPFKVDGYCIACVAPARMDVGYEFSVTDAAGAPLPNWREHLVCECGMNARVRALVHVLTEFEGLNAGDAVYVMEQRSPLYRWLTRRCSRVTGSEYLDGGAAPGSIVDGVRHEDATALSFPDGSFDYVISCDVFEHVPDYRRALAEAWRCLRPGGRLLFTVPFLAHSPDTHVRARLTPSGAIEHLAPAEYHGDPQRPDDGALCFQHFGWDLLSDLEAAAFQRVECLLIWSRTFGYLGEHRVFRAAKPGPPSSASVSHQ